MQLPQLDEDLLARILPFVTEVNASPSCRSWKDYLYEALKLDVRIAFMQRVRQQGSVLFCYNAVRPLGEDFEESVGYNFTFLEGGSYRLAWTRTYDAWSSQGEQHLGKWSIEREHLHCETLAPEASTVSETEMRYAPAGYKFAVPLKEILAAKGGYFEAPEGSKAADWELPARTGKQSQVYDPIFPSEHADSGDTITAAAIAAMTLPAPPRSDARFVEIDGEIHEVSGDIVANWPEEQWPRLMRCRLRFGING